MEWRPAGWSVCLPLLISLCTIKSRSSLLAPAHPGDPGKKDCKTVVVWWWWNPVCTYPTTKKKDIATKHLHTQLTFSHWWRQSSTHKWLTLHQFVDRGVRVNQAYYCNVMLFQQLLPAICKISSKFIFQQDSALAHRTLRQSTFPHNYQILSNFKNSFKTDSAVN